MSIGLEGQNLIFLISQPRSGSTLTQRILGSHPDIHTLAEPWLMLHPSYGMKSVGYEAEYNADWARTIVQQFLQELPTGEKAYYEGLRRMYTYLYESALTGSGKHYFLDKTPRYYHIIPELYQTFPQSDFIFLFRNPLAVVGSIITTWTKEEWHNLDDYKQDLIKAPQLLLEGISLIKNRCHVLRYEDLLIDPTREIKKIYLRMNIEFHREMINYGNNDFSHWKFGDQKMVNKQTKPDPKNLNTWVLSLNNPKIWQVSNDYLEFLGHEILYQMGYSYRELRKTLDANRPQTLNSARIFGIDWMQRQPELPLQKPQTSPGYMVMAQRLKREGKLREAVVAYRKAIKLNSHSAWCYNNLGGVLAKLNKWDEAITAYEQAIELNPNSASLYYNLAEALIHQGNLDEAVTFYYKAIELKSDFSIYHNSLGEALVRHTKLTEAINYFYKAIELNPKYYKPYGNLAKVLAQQGNLDEAVKYYHLALKLNPTAQIVNSNFGEGIK